MAIRQPKPEWLKVRFPAGPGYQRIRELMRAKELHTVCEEARCPNIGDCWSRGTATFMILGDTCPLPVASAQSRPAAQAPTTPASPHASRSPSATWGSATPSSEREPRQAPDGGATIFADTIRWIRRLAPETTIEVLIPDFKGNRDALATVMDAQPEILNHNTETVPRLYRRVRPQADYAQSLDVLRTARELDPGALTKSGVMVGLGETFDELVQVFADLAAQDVDILTVGQYLQPTPEHLPIDRYWHPDEFAALKDRALALGFRHVEAGPLVRSSYHAEQQPGWPAEPRRAAPPATAVASSMCHRRREERVLPRGVLSGEG
jgi:lipoic acid synthetase